MRSRIIKAGIWAAAFSVVIAFFATASSVAQSGSGPVLGRIKCQGSDSVNVTADAEQAIPLQLVATAACGDVVTILSDPQGYTVKIRTFRGSVGYVTRYEVVVDPNAVPKSSPIVVIGHRAAGTQTQVQPQSQPAKAPSDKGPHKPRVFISDSESWAETGGFGSPPVGDSGSLYAGYNPEMVDVYQNFTSDCTAVTVVQDKKDADYAILFDKGSSKKGVKGLGGLVKVNKFTVVSRTGETLISDESHSADTAVRMTCGAIAQKAAAGASAPSSK